MEASSGFTQALHSENPNFDEKQAIIKSNQSKDQVKQSMKSQELKHNYDFIQVEWAQSFLGGDDGAT